MAKRQEPTYTMTLVSIDPSINSLGYALFHGDPNYPVDSLRNNNWQWGMFRPDRERLYESIRDFFDLHVRLDITYLIAEIPEYFDSERGQIAARMGDTTQLAMIPAYLAGWMSLDDNHFIRYHPREWKGQMPKHATKMKAMRTFKDSSMEIKEMGHDSLDALMMLRFHLTRIYGWPK